MGLAMGRAGAGNQWAPGRRPAAGCCAPPPSEPRGPDSPRAASPAQSRATRYGPIQTRQLRRQNAATFPHIRNLACVRGNSAREFGPRRFPALPGPAREGEPGGLTPPPWVPRSRAETGATSAERRTAVPVPCVPCVPAPPGVFLPARTDALLLVSTRAREGVVPTSVLQCRYECDYCRAVH